MPSGRGVSEFGGWVCRWRPTEEGGQGSLVWGEDGGDVQVEVSLVEVLVGCGR